MTKSAIISQAIITRVVKAVEKSGANMIIEIAQNGSIVVVPARLVNRGKPVNYFELDYRKDLDF